MSFFCSEAGKAHAIIGNNAAERRQSFLHRDAVSTLFALNFRRFRDGTHLADQTLEGMTMRAAILTGDPAQNRTRSRKIIMRHEKRFPAVLTPRFTHLAVRIAAGDIAHVGANAPMHGASDTADTCAEMFKFCKQCDEKYLHPRKIQCLFDVDSGAMNRAALRLVREIIESLLADISRNGVCHANGASLTVTLRRRHRAWILAVTERRIASLRRTATARRLSLVRRHAQLLGAACRVHETNEGFITALMFDGTAAASDRRGGYSSETVH